MSMRRKSCAVAVAAGVIVVSGGCARDVLAPAPAPAESGATLRIVGPMPVGTDQQPAFIVDGVPVEAAQGRLDQLDPADIHSIEIIKGAAAVRLYGTAGRNGVILIRTKRGAEQ